MRNSLVFLCLLTFPVTVQSQSVNFSEHIAPLIYNHCTSCHRPGEIGPFPLTNYSEVASWGPMIQYVTDIGYMPPWKPEIGYQQYRNENYLTAAEVQKIADWVNQGMPQGDPALEPPLPIFPSGSQVGNPDTVLTFAQSYLHLGNNEDEYRYFVLPTGLIQDRDLVALEIRPGNKSIVHHTLVWQDTTGQAAAEDAATPEYGYEGNTGSAGLSGLNSQLPGYVPGVKPIVYTDGIGYRLFAGSDLKIQMHYAPTVTDEYDSSSINLFFAPQPVTRYLKSHVMIALPGVLTNGPFIIPANQVKVFHGQYTVPTDISMVGIGPHMHMLGQYWKVYAVKPNGDTIPLININEWDFNWQGGYNFRSLLPLPAGSVIHAYAKYDNTNNNINNPNNPPQLVTWGENTSDEMFYLPLLFLDYQTGDENITFNDSTGITGLASLISSDKLYPIHPNPGSGIVKIGFTLERGDIVSLKVMDVNGRLVNTIIRNQFCLPGFHTNELDVSTLPTGIFNVVLETSGGRYAQKLIVRH